MTEMEFFTALLVGVTLIVVSVIRTAVSKRQEQFEKYEKADAIDQA